MTGKVDIDPLAASLLDNKFIAVLVVSDDKIKMANKKACELSGYDSASLKKKKFQEMVEFDQVNNSLANLLKLGEDVVIRGQLLHKDGTKHPVDFSVNQVENSNYLSVFISQTYDRESFLFLKRQFFKRITHELRSPLSSIVGALALLKSGKLARVDNILSIALRNSKRLTLMINSILDIENFEGGTLFVQKMLYDLDEVLQAATSLVEEYANENHVDIKLESKSINIAADYEKLPQSIGQLLRYLIDENPGLSEIVIETTDKDGWADVKLKIHSLKEVSAEEIDQKGFLPTFSLNMAKQVIELHQGTVTGLENKNEDIWIRLPIAQI